MEDLNLNKERNSLIQLIWEEKKMLFLITVSMIFISFIGSFLITPLFLSTAIVFPAESSNVSFSDQRNGNTEAMDFGEEEQAEQLVQILQSSRIRDKVVLYSSSSITEQVGCSVIEVNSIYLDNRTFC